MHWNAAAILDFVIFYLNTNIFETIQQNSIFFFAMSYVIHYLSKINLRIFSFFDFFYFLLVPMFRRWWIFFFSINSRFSQNFVGKWKKCFKQKRREIIEGILWYFGDFLVFGIHSNTHMKSWNHRTLHKFMWI
jgi:hypothetical protein